MAATRRPHRARPHDGGAPRGHARLIERARAECDCVVVSIFVNPLQFDREDDLARYPRTIDADLDLCESLGTDVVFVPTPAEMYPSPPVVRWMWASSAIICAGVIVPAISAASRRWC